MAWLRMGGLLSKEKQAEGAKKKGMFDLYA